MNNPAAVATPVWSVINQKGGVGKTTTAVALAAASAGDGGCLLVDMDPHASASRYFGRSAPALFEALRDPTAAPAVTASGIAGLDLLTASSELATFGRDGGQGAGLALRRLLANVRGYQRIIVDGPPTLGVLMVNALVAAQQVIVPTLTDPLAGHGVEGLDRTLEQIGRSLGQRPPWCIVPTLVDRRTRSAHDGLRKLAERWGDALWDDYIPMDTQVREASSVGQAVQQFAPDSRAARAYRRLYAELCGAAAPNRSAA